MDPLDVILARRARLLAKVQEDREALAATLAQASLLRAADRTSRAVLWLRGNPLVAGIAAAAVVIAGRRSGMRLTRLALTAWQAWRWAARLGLVPGRSEAGK
jgi:hypothetical protein